MKISYKCRTCNKITKIFPSQMNILGRGKWCSKKCRYPDKVGVKCPTCGKIKLLPPSIAINAKYCSFACKAKDYKTTKKGENNPSWKGGVTRLGHKIRTSDKYIKFRVGILIRDGGYCKTCGSYKKLHIHHKKELWKLIEEYKKLNKPFDPEDEFFYDKSNLITLCQKCHVKLKV